MRTSTRSLSLVPRLAVLLLATGLPLSAQEGEAADLTTVPSAVREAMMRGEYSAARAELVRLESELPGQDDFWLYLRARAFFLEDDMEQALALLDRFAAEHPESAWRFKARFLQADAMRSLRRYDQAERIYEEEALRLRSAERQRELASIYLEFADRLSTEPETPSPKAPELDFRRAYLLYEKVLDLGAPRDSREQARFRMGYCMQQVQEWQTAVGAFRSYLLEFDPLAEQALPPVPGSGARVFDARYRLGQCQQSMGRPVEARRTFEDLDAAARTVLFTNAWGDVEVAVEPEQVGEIERLQGLARYAISRTHETGNANQGGLAIAALERFLEDFPRHERAPRAAFDIASIYQTLGRDDDAIAAFDTFLARPLAGGASEEVREEDARLRMRSLFLKGEVLMRQKRFAEAGAVFGDYAGRYPTGSDWSSAQRGIIEAEYRVGAEQRQAREFAAARTSWAAFLEQHPLDARSATILFDIGALYEEEGREAEKEAKDSDDPETGRQATAALYRDAIAQWGKLATKYAGSNEASQGLFRTGLVYETRLLELTEAIAAYQRCNFGGWAGQARQRLQTMTQPSLAIATERTWRSEESPKVKVQIRNMEELQVQLYELDLEAYFRKHLTHRRIEDLDLDLIAADQSLTVEVDDYADFKPIEQDVELPIEGPGVWAVAVTAGDQRATTLVVRSDIDVIVKSSRREVFVFAQDMQHEIPAAGVDVLVAVPGVGGGAPVLRELSTGDDGVARLRFEELEGGEELRVFAARDGHCASNGLDLRGLQLATGLQPRGYVYTDRSAYRPGQEVHWRAVVRAVSDGAYAFEEGRKYRVLIADSQGRVFLRRSVQLGPFGTLHGSVTLDAAAPVGSYTITCQAASGQASAGSFQVAEYQVPKVELEFDLERDVYYRGEEVEVTARAAYYYGEPVVDSPIAYRLPDGREGTARTDAEGRASFRFGTRDFPNEGMLGFSARLTEEGASASGAVYLATRGYAATLSTPRSLYLAGGGFDAILRTVSPDGSPVARSMRLTVLRRESVPDGTWREFEVEEHALQTGEETGEVRKGLALQEGGNYLLRVEGLDRFGNPVQAEHALFVSGEGDAVKLRLLAGDFRLEVGEDIAVDLHNRAGGGLALVTFEGEEILEYRLVDLREGSNALSFEVDHAHFPNFVLAAAFMRGNSFFTASAEFDVARELRVVVEPARDVLAPGGEAEVLLKATDQLGRPVEAELSFAVVDAALFDLYPDRTAPIRGFFEQGARRHAALRTATSCTFRYEGRTTTISSEILAEAARLAAEQKWLERREQTVAILADVQEGLVVDLDRKPQAPAAKAHLGLRFAAGEEWNDAIGMGGGAGGSFGRRAGGRMRGSQTVLRKDFPETAFWAPAVRTGPDGTARLSFPMPDQATRWTLVCRGVGNDTLVGQATAGIRTRSELFVELVAPAVLLEGDRPRLVARVHNLSGAAGTASLRLRVTAAGESRSLPVQVELSAEGVTEHVFAPLPALGSQGELQLAAEVEAALGGRTLRDAVQRTIPVQPWGVEFAASASGLLQTESTVWLDLPAGRRYAGRTVELFVGPGLYQMLVDEALGQVRPHRGVRPDPVTHARTAGELLGVCATMELLGRSGRTLNPEYARLAERAESLAGSLVAAQRPDGGWGWIRRGGSARVEDSCRVMFALARARAVGVELPPVTLDRGIASLQKAFREAPQRADELKAMLVHALATLDQGDFGAANRLHRQRNTLSPAALAYTALALLEMERAPMAAEIAALLESRMQGGRCPVEGNLAWNRSQLEMNALALLTLQLARPESEEIAPGIALLLAQRPWHPARARGLCLEAVALYQGVTQPAGDRQVVTVRVAGGEPLVLELAPGASGQSVTVPLDDRAGGRVRVDLSRQGRGQPHYSAVLRGFSTDVKRTNSTWMRFTRTEYRAALPSYRGKSVQTGFRTVQLRDEGWRNLVRSLPLGQVTHGHVEYYRQFDRAEPEEAVDFLVLDVPLPAGTRILPESVRGNLLGFEIRDGMLSVQIGQHRGSGHLDYTLVGSVPGEYRALPAALRSVYEPGRMALSDPAELAVLTREATSPDPYRPTPDELYDLGTAAYEAGDSELAWSLLSGLYDEFEKELREDPLRQSARMLLFLSLDREDPRPIVRFFEVLKEKNPELTIPFEKVLAVGEAYRKLEEFERALLIFRATIEETFGKDLKVAGTLEEQGEFAGASDALERFCREFPDSPAVIDTWLALSDKLLTKAPAADQDASLKRAQRDRAHLSLQGILLLQRLLAFYPQDPLAPEAGLNLVSAYLGLEDFTTASEHAGSMAELYTEPKFADAFRYTRAVAEWYLGNEDEAMELLLGIAEAVYTDAAGMEQHSENRDLALYILGQIHHARQDVAKAREYYERVEELFADAREVLAGFSEKSIALEEVTTARPGDPVNLGVTYRNVREAELLVYPVDLMTLYLREKNLASITQVNLAGIAPALRRTVSLGEGKDLRPEEQKFELGLEDPGAYLVICRGDELHASGLVLVSDLDLQVKEDPVSGRLRVQVADGRDGSYVRDADVRVIGSSNQAFISGRTDPRGLFVADGVQGRTTVIARLDDRNYAFYRGETPLGEPEEVQRGDYFDEDGEAFKQIDKKGYLRNVFDQNRELQGQRQQRLQEQIDRDSLGVKVKQVN